MFGMHMNVYVCFYMKMQHSHVLPVTHIYRSILKVHFIPTVSKRVFSRSAQLSPRHSPHSQYTD